MLPAVNPTLGPEVDTESDGQPDPSHLGDDDAGSPDDEDGVVFTGDLGPGAWGLALMALLLGALELRALRRRGLPNRR